MERKMVVRALGLAAAACALLGGAGVASADVFNLGGVRDPRTGQWTGTASLETVTVGNAGNAADPTTDFGAVNYGYNIGKYEVTAGQYTEFLNAVAGVDTYGLYKPNMWVDTTYGCLIERYAGEGTTESPYQYRVAADSANRPVNYVNFWDACRFANWLSNGQGGAGTTEYGTYTLTAEAITNNTVTRNAGATWAVASEDEWYKAAYYDASLNGGDGGYWLYPTGSNDTPGNDLADVSGNNANIKIRGTPFPIQDPFHTTVVGQFANSASAYGTFDQGGNLWEWNEWAHSYWWGGEYWTSRGVRGGSWGTNVSDGDALASWSRDGLMTTRESYIQGFRVVQVPEPGCVAILGMGIAGMLVGRRRRRA